MGYVLKTRKGTIMGSGRRSTGGCLRTYGNRAVVYDTKKQAAKALDIAIKKWTKDPYKRKVYKNRICVKKV